MKLIVGLGNPGRKYDNTWHNLGAKTVEELAKRWNVVLRPGKGEFIGEEYRLNDRKIMLMIPTSYMNRSGGPVGQWLFYFGIHPGQLLVISDDHDLPLGEIRLRPKGTAGGHNGLDDIIKRLGTDNFPRLRIGIRTDTEHDDLADQVLSEIPKVHRERVERIILNSADAVEMMIDTNIEATMGKYNGLTIE